MTRKIYEEWFLFCVPKGIKGAIWNFCSKFFEEANLVIGGSRKHAPPPPYPPPPPPLPHFVRLRHPNGARLQSEQKFVRFPKFPDCSEKRLLLEKNEGLRILPL